MSCTGWWLIYLFGSLQLVTKKELAFSAATTFGQYGNYIRFLEVESEVIPVSANELYITESQPILINLINNSHNNKRA